MADTRLLSREITVRGYFCGNLGDDLFLLLLMRKFPECHFQVIGERKYLRALLAGSPHHISVPLCYNKIVRALCKGIGCVFPNIKEWLYLLFWKLEFKKLAKKTSACIYIGGSLFMEGEKTIGLAEKINSLMAEAFPNSLFIIGASFGPWRNQQYVDFYRSFWLKCRGVSFRDQKSSLLFIGISQIHCHPDLIWSTDFQTGKPISASIAIVVMNYTGMHEYNDLVLEYEQKTAALADELCRRSKLVTFFAFCPADGDETAAKRIRSLMRYKNEVRIEAYYGNALQYVQKFLTNETIVATRFHSVVLGLSGCRKVLPLIYHMKTDYMLDEIQYNFPRLKLKDFCRKSTDELIPLIDDARIFEIPLHLKEEANQHFDILDRKSKHVDIGHDQFKFRKRA